MKLANTSNHNKARIEIIPLIDIMFFLLATFVLVSFSMIENRGLVVDLPSSQTSDTQGGIDKKSDAQITNINVLRSGDILVDKKKTTAEDLEALLSAKAKDASLKDLQVRIQADKQSPLEKTVSVMDIARKLGISDVLLHTTVKNQ